MVGVSEDEQKAEGDNKEGVETEFHKEEGSEAAPLHVYGSFHHRVPQEGGVSWGWCETW